MPSLLPPDCLAKVTVFGPAYLDHIVRVRGPLCGADWPEPGAPAVRLDYSRTEAERSPCDEPGVFLHVQSPAGDAIRIEGGGAAGTVVRIAEDRICDPDAVRRATGCDCLPRIRSVVELEDEWVQLGGMGSGFALALGGHLVAPVGASDRAAAQVAALLTENHVDHTLVPVDNASTDTTTLILSDAGDKLPVGRRGAIMQVSACDLLAAGHDGEIVILSASLPNRLVLELASAIEGWKLFTPSLRSIRQGDIEEIAPHVDAMSMNETEWAGVGDHESVLAHCPVVAVTRGDRGATLHYHGPEGSRDVVHVPAAPPPAVVDINRAGEAFAAGLVGALLGRAGLGAMRCGYYRRGVVRGAAWEAAIAAALELGISETRFPSREEVLVCRMQLGGPPAG